MAGKFLADLPINPALIGSEMGVLGDRVDDDRLQRSGSHFWDMEAPNLAAALNQGHYRFLWRGSLIGAVLCFAASKGLVSLDELTFAAEAPEQKSLIEAAGLS